jgi:hypothetical protein
MIHGGTNVWAKSGAMNAIYGMSPPYVDVRFLILAVTALVLVVISGSQLG